MLHPKVPHENARGHCYLAWTCAAVHAGLLDMTDSPEALKASANLIWLGRFCILNGISLSLLRAVLKLHTDTPGPLTQPGPSSCKPGPG